MTQIKDVGDQLLRSPYRYVPVSDLTGVGSPMKNAFVRLTLTRQLQGAPQTTAAIRLDQVNRFMSQTGALVRPGKEAPLNEDQNDLMGMDRGDMAIAGRAALGAPLALLSYRNRLLPEREPSSSGLESVTDSDRPSEMDLQVGSGALLGLLTLAASYLIRGDEAATSYAKNIAIVMARTDFGSLFRHLTAEERKHFAADGGAAFAALALDAAGLSGTEATPLFKNGLHYEDRPGRRHDPRVLDGLTRGLWLTTITRGKDLLSKAGTDIKAAKPEMESLGALGPRTETVGRGVAAPIFELRRMQNQVPYTEWPGLALDVFDYLVSLNKLEATARYSRLNR